MIYDPLILNRVAEFHKQFEQPILETPTIPDVKRQILRVGLIHEELEELKDAIGDENMVEIADALADLMYVVAGTVLEFGLQNKFNDIFEDVHNSNMSKACSSVTALTETIVYYTTKGIKVYSKLIDGKHVVFRKEDDKVLKSNYYRPANIKEILDDV